MADKKYIVTVVGVMKKNNVMAHAGEEVSPEDFNNFDERVKGAYVKEKSDYAKDQKQSDEDQLKTAEVKNRTDLVVAYKKAFKVDAPADASTDDIKKAIADEKIISSGGAGDEGKASDIDTEKGEEESSQDTGLDTTQKPPKKLI